MATGITILSLDELNMSELEGKSAEKELSRLVEELMTFKDQMGALNKEIKELKKEKEEVERDILALIEREGGDAIMLSKPVKGVLYVGKGSLSGGGYFISNWEKPTVKMAKDAKAAKKSGLI